MQLSRRHALMGFVTGLATVSLDWLLGTAPASAADGTCVLWPQLDEGPYYFDTKLVRADITEGRPGAPLKLNLLVVESGPCKPMAGIRVDVWHADAGGFIRAILAKATSEIRRRGVRNTCEARK